MSEIPIGPALDEGELHELYSYVSDPRWPVFREYLGRIYEAADENLMRIGKGEAWDSYWKGVKKLSKDLKKLPEDLDKQLNPPKEE